MSDNEVKLRVENVCLNFGGVQAIDGVSFDIRDGELLALIGPNGAGKTCILNCINGFYHTGEGDVYFEGRAITNLKTYEVARLGIARVFQGVQLYTGLNTLDNIMAARQSHMKRNIFDEAIYFGRAHKEEIEHRRKAEEIIDFLEMEPIRKKPAGVLPYGMRKRVDLGRALAMDPTLLLLDEPMAGMNLEEKEDMARFILDVSEQKKTTILLVEHDMGVVMDIADRIVVLDFGKKIAEGTPEEVMINPAVIHAYLGMEWQK